MTWYFILCGLLWEFPHKPGDACVLSDKGITKVYNRDVSIISAPVSVSQPSPQHVQDSFTLHACTKQFSDASGQMSINLFFVLESILHELIFFFISPHFYTCISGKNVNIFNVSYIFIFKSLESLNLICSHITVFYCINVVIDWAMNLGFKKL